MPRRRDWRGTWQRRAQPRWRMGLESSHACRHCKLRTSYYLAYSRYPSALGACTRLLCHMPITVCPRPHGSWNASAD